MVCGFVWVWKSCGWVVKSSECGIESQCVSQSRQQANITNSFIKGIVDVWQLEATVCFNSMACIGPAVKSTGIKLWWVRVPVVGSSPSHDTRVSVSKTLNHCFVLWMGRKAVGPVCCVMHIKETQCTYQKEKGFAPVFLVWLAAYCAIAPCKPLHGAIKE